MSPSRFAVTSTPRPTTRARRPAVSALPRIHGHHPAAGDPDDRPVPARQVIHAGPGIPRPRLNSGQTPRSPQLPDDINGTDQALHSARTPSAEHHSPTTDSAPRDRKPGSGQDPHKIPTPHAAHRPHQHHADITALKHFRWSEARLASSRDRTRTYNLPVNRRSVMAGSARGCQQRHPVLPA